MKPRRFSILRRFAVVIFSLIAVLGLLFIVITYLSTTYYHEASTQLLNKEVAAHIAKFTSPFEKEGINRQKADSVFYNAMVISPSAEVYFLDTGGKVVAFHASEKEIQAWTVDLSPLRQYIRDKGGKYIKGADPKDPSHQKIFSAAEVLETGKRLGYIYVILGSKKSESLMDVLFGGHVLNLAVKAFIVVLLLSALASFIYLRRVRKNFRQTTSVLERFEAGDYDARFEVRENDELEPITHAFNKMADLLSSSIRKLTKSEGERKTFIATISHDLRTPLSIARGYIETLFLKKEKGELRPGEGEHYSQLIYGKLLQIENMVKQLFELSKMEAVEFKPQKEPFVLSEIVQEAVNNFGLLAAEKAVHLKCDQCLYHVWVDADVSMMERVVQNLLENAVKSTPAGGHIQSALAVEGNRLVFKVENDGPPLSFDLLKWINSNKDGDAFAGERPQKAGLGLLIVQKILHLHQTSLIAQTANGKNIFTFALPVYNTPS